MIHKLLGIAGFGLLLASTAFTQSIAQSTAFMNTGRLVRQPIGHAEFCRNFKEECEVRSTDTAPFHLTQRRWREMLETNHLANTKVEPVTDLDLYGKEEFWTYPKSFGDCEDYVLLKRKILIEKGWPEAALLVTVVIRPDGEGHAVLTVRTDRGEFVLDNLEDRIERWDKTPYRFVKRQAKSHSGRWVSISDTRSSVASIRYGG